MKKNKYECNQERVQLVTHHHTMRKYAKKLIKNIEN